MMVSDSTIDDPFSICIDAHTTLKLAGNKHKHGYFLADVERRPSLRVQTGS